jgi:alpha/beta superfamily hydrolase
LPLPMAIAAAGYVEKYGPNERYKYLQVLPSVPCPTLVLLGSVEIASNIAFQEAPAAVAKIAESQPRVKLALVERADHFYTGVRQEAWQEIENWLPLAARASCG